MRKTSYLVGALACVALLGVGCQGPEQKLGRGFGNVTEVARLGEFNRSVEQEGIFGGPDTGLATGLVRGFDHSIQRTGLGLYEVITFPIPPYHPIWTDQVSAKPLYPDAYHPRKLSDSLFDADRMTGFSGGDVAPFLPGSKFAVFDN